MDESILQAFYPIKIIVTYHNLLIFTYMQIEAVTEKQNSLMEILDKMENAKTEEEVDSLRPVAQGLKEKADAGLIILNVSTCMYRVLE